MNSTTLIPSSRCSSSHPNLLFSPPRLVSQTNLCSRKYLHNRLRMSTVRCSVGSDVFGGKRGIKSLVDAMSPSVRLASSALVFAGAVAAGYILGIRFGGSIRNAIALGAAVAGAAFALNSPAVNMHNSDDPAAVKKEDTAGVSKQDQALNAKRCDLYGRFVYDVLLPPVNEDLKGNEVETILKLKKTLGIDDPDAAAMHMEIGRTIFRQRLLETGDGDQEQRRAFQKLLIVSTLVFGEEASSSLLPWKRVFKVTESQVEVATQDTARGLYAVKLKSTIGRDDLAPGRLVSLRHAQLLYQLSDEHAQDMFREHTRKLVEENITNILKSSKTGISTTVIVEEINKILVFNHALISLSTHPDANNNFARGLGPVSLLGGVDERKMDDLKLLFRAYATDALSSGRMEDNKLAALNQLRDIFGLGKHEAESIVLDVTSMVYRKQLAQAVSSGNLEAATSKAEFLQELCDELHFNPERAIAIHEEIYRQKLQQLVADGRELSDGDVKALERVQVLLCIPRHTVEAVHADICGSLFEKVVKEAIAAAGVDGYDADVKQSVRKAAHCVLLTREVAISIASKAVRKIFMTTYIQRARAAGSRTESAKQLKKMIAFNNSVVTELVADIKGESSEKEPTKVETKQMDDDEYEEWESIQSLRKIRRLNKKLASHNNSQSEITLKDDLQERERTDLYKSYLLFCLAGQLTSIPLDLRITTKKDEDSEYVSLNQLGEILGMTSKETVEVHRSLAEQAFRLQAEVILADGQLTKARIEQLNELQKQVGLPAEYSQKIIKSITTRTMAAALETAVGQGRIIIKEIRELKEAGVDFNTIISENLREKLFKKTVDEMFFSSGTGEFEEEEVYERIPQDLNINIEKAKRVVHELARTRLTNSLVEAVALLRQQNRQGVVSSLNNLLACDKAVAAQQPLSWEVPGELADIFVIYLQSDPAPEKLSRLQYLLNIGESAAEAL